MINLPGSHIQIHFVISQIKSFRKFLPGFAYDKSDTGFEICFNNFIL